jgi:SAM-dependent methyltransferase
MTDSAAPSASVRAAPSASVRPTPPVSSRDAPRFATRERHQELASAFQSQGGDYDRLRPGYPAAVLDALGGALSSEGSLSPGDGDVVDLGAGTGKLSLQLVARGLDVTAVDPSRSMLETAERALARATDEHGAAGPADAEPEPSASAPGSLHTLVATAEDTGLPDASADLVTVAQAWHWFDTAAAGAEIARILRPGGVLALLWNSLDVQIPWVHRYSRIMHAGDVHRDDFTPPITPHFTLRERIVERWEDQRTTHELIDLARTRSYVITAPPERREKVLANLDWYLHEHLGHAPGSEVGMPYRTDLFLFAVGDDAAGQSA